MPATAGAAEPNSPPVAVDDPANPCIFAADLFFRGYFAYEDGDPTGWPQGWGDCWVGNNDTDPDGDPLVAFEVVEPPAHGDLDFTADGGWEYTPDPDFSTAYGDCPSDTFTYRASDGAAWSEPAEVDICVFPLNDPPSFTPGPELVEVDEDSGAYSGQWATDVSAGPFEDDQDVTFEVTTNSPQVFSVQPAISPAGVLTFTPAPNAYWLAKVTVSLTDDGGSSSVNGHPQFDTSPSTTFDVVIWPDSSPVAVDDEATVPVGAPSTELHVLANDHDPEGSTLEVVAVSDPPKGTATAGFDRVYYQPDAGATGFDAFTYTIKGGDTATVSVAIGPIHTLSGTVSMGGGGPAAGANVHAFDAQTFAWLGYDTANSAGGYAMDLPEGEYRLYVQPNAPGYDDGWGPDVNLDADSDVDIVVPAKHIVSGTVTKSGGGPAAGANVHAFDAQTFAWLGYDTTDGAGEYGLRLPAGTYLLYVQPNATGYRDGVAAEVTVDGVEDVDMMLRQWHALSGTLTKSGGGPAAGAYVHAFDAATGAWTGWDTADGAGNYAIDLPEGSYRLYVQPNVAGYDDGWGPTVTVDQARDVDFVVPATHTLSGTVSKGTQPAVGANVHAFRAGTGEWVGWDTTDSTGQYVMALPAGSYELYVQPNSPQYPNQWGPDVTLDMDREVDFRLTAGPTGAS